MRELPVRKNIRLKNHDYSQAGSYFITMCIEDRYEMLWIPDSVGARIARPPLSEAGEVVKMAIENIPRLYSSVSIDHYVIMPNHIHMIMSIREDSGRAMRAPTVSRMINQMKGYVTKQLGFSLWQKLFHDHIIRDDSEYQLIWRYIDENPANWQEDCYYKE